MFKSPCKQIVNSARKTRKKPLRNIANPLQIAAISITLFMVLFEGDWELERALMCLLGAKMYTTFRSARICALRGERVNVKQNNLSCCKSFLTTLRQMDRESDPTIWERLWIISIYTSLLVSLRGDLVKPLSCIQYSASLVCRCVMITTNGY